MDNPWKWVARIAWFIAIFLFLKSWEDNMKTIRMFYDTITPWQFMLFLVLVGAFFALWKWRLNSIIKRRFPNTLSDLMKSVRVIKNPQGYQYLVENDKCFHIPDPDTFNYLSNFFGFTWDDSEEMQPDDIKRKFSLGRTLPSIRAYFPNR